MIVTPNFEHTVLVTDDHVLAARISSVFRRPRYYFAVMNGPRMRRADADNEVVRGRNAIGSVGPRNILLGGLSSEAVTAMRRGSQTSVVSHDYEELVGALRGSVSRPQKTLPWGRTNLGVGLYRARLERKELVTDLDFSPEFNYVGAGTHLLVVCERGDELAEVVASNLAFACGASYATIPELGKSDREAWLEELYALGDGGDVTGRFGDIAQRARAHLGGFDYTRYKEVLFVTAGFPWGIAVPEVPTTHMYRYPDFGRATIQGIWVSQAASRSARTALLVDPQTVEGSEIPAINKALVKNKTLTRILCGPSATINRVQSIIDLLPQDIIVFSTHAGDSSGERVTYEFDDAEGRTRRLTIDQAVGLGFDPISQQFKVSEYNYFHSLDGVDWRDEEGKKSLAVGTAITTWAAMDGPLERTKHIVKSEEISRVQGSMALKLHDGIWLYASHAFPPESAPIVVNNSCWSWHELSLRTTFAGARAYVGSLFPITDAEAQEVGQALFGEHIGKDLAKALWLAQKHTYGSSKRRPYVMIGLPFISIRHNTVDSVKFTNEAYGAGIAHWSYRAKTSQYADVRANAEHFVGFLMQDFKTFQQQFARHLGKLP